MAQSCFEKAEASKKDEIYQESLRYYTSNQIHYLRIALEQFKSISGWEDADEKAEQCKQKIEQLNAKAAREAEEKRAAAKKRKKALAVATSILCICIGFLIVWNSAIVPNRKYKEALSLLADGNPDNLIQGYEQLIALNGFKDSEAKAAEALAQYKVEKLKNSAVGDTVYFGKYEQDNDASNGAEDIEWIILAKKEDSCLVISKYALDRKPYDVKHESVTWSTSSLRNWLNNEFLNKAFSEEEINQIPTVRVTADENSSYRTDPGVATSDKIFLLSIKEAEQFFTTDEARRCAPTAYAKAQGAYTNFGYQTSSGEASCYWWLRSPGYNQRYAARVDDGGFVYYGGDDVVYGGGSVRPALWITLDS